MPHVTIDVTRPRILTVVGIWVKADKHPDPVLLSTKSSEHRRVGNRTALRLRQSRSTLKGETEVTGGQGDHGVLSQAVEGVLSSVQCFDVRVTPRPGCRQSNGVRSLTLPRLNQHTRELVSA